MSRLLYIQASPTGKFSYSLRVADAFIEEYRKKNPDDRIITMDIFKEPLPAFDEAAASAKYRILHGINPTKEDQNIWKNIETVIERFKNADKYVLAVPMWNFSIPYRLKQYIDILVQPGYTFAYSAEKGYQGLVTGRPLLAIYARGGQYSKGSPEEAIDFQSKYIDFIFRFMGFEKIVPIVVEPTLQGGPDTAEKKCQDAVKKAAELAKTF
jgi:FMN-dependent NADH-azoreductase